ncbi:CsbD family protein [Ancylobacter sp. SL191]|uniref:CsbD family protein n=1 Tax=Ancylobacter sp. SL191 TaxID=2995166 RepID=UPI00226E4B27|nr:CsbD family protein [Ancylobacter sp. SL191]WAC26490.1 CsbD family protein [Ancylobacter sp. SL191]
MAERINGALLILSGGARELWGRALRDRETALHGRCEQLAGRAAIACARARLSIRAAQTT